MAGRVPALLAPAQPLASKTDLAEPNWVKVLGSSATQVWSMVKTFRERGNHEIAASLEAAAEKQAGTGGKDK